MDIEAQRIRTYDEAGRLTQAGFWWWQTEEKRDELLRKSQSSAEFSLLASVPCASLVLYGANFFFVEMPLFTVMSLLAVPVAVLVIIVCWRARARGWHRQKAGLIFLADGSIDELTRLSLLQDRSEQRWIRLREHAGDITVIELRPVRTIGGGHFRTSAGHLAYNVHMHFTSGDRFIIADNVSESDGYIIVAQLNHARADLSGAIKRSLLNRQSQTRR